MEAGRRICRSVLAGRCGRRPLPRLLSSSSSSSSPPDAVGPQTTEAESDRDLASTQSELLDEASSLTRRLYRRCLRSASALSSANDRDESDFREREEAQRRQFEGSSSELSMAPPVDRANELRSRSDYYRSFARENFDGHWDLLGEHGFHVGTAGSMADGLGGTARHHSWDDGRGMGDGERSGTTLRPWREERVEQFAYLIRTGEEKRRYVLEDYGFADPCCGSGGGTGDDWPAELEERLRRFEELSSDLTRETYRRQGWVHSSTFAEVGSAVQGGEEDDEDFDSDDEG